MSEKKTGKWVRLDNESGTATLKQHYFVPHVIGRRYTGEEYTGNISLCGNVWHGNENGEIEDFDKIVGEPIGDNICLRCLKKSLTP